MAIPALAGGLQEIAPVSCHLVGALSVIQLLLRRDLLFEQLLDSEVVALGKFEFGVGGFDLCFRLGRHRRLKVGGLGVASGFGLTHLGL